MKRGGSETPPPAKRSRRTLNEIPELSPHRLNVYIFGSGTICELGLGPHVTNVKRPRLSPLLPASEVGIVALAAGGAHTVALDHEGHLWTWGQNDSGALGRPTKESAEVIDEDNDLNSKESTPGRVQGLKEDLKFVAVGATDNVSAAITESGRVWAWGTFIDDGQKAFAPGTKFQTAPMQLPSIKGAVALAGGKDHLLILTTQGYVYAWGIGTSYQLGVPVRPTLRTKTQGPLRVPRLKDIVYISAGDYHSFAIDSSGRVWAWGLNNFGQCGLSDPVGPNTFIEKPTHVEEWDGKHVVQIASGGHHTVWLTADGSIYTQGETNFHQLGVPYDKLPENTVREQDGTPSFVPTATKLGQGSFEEEPVDPLPPFKYIAAGTDHSLAISRTDGSTWTWGFGEVFQLGHGKPAGEDDPEDEPVPRRIKNTATTGVNMCWAGAGGQFSVIAAAIDDQPAEALNGNAAVKKSE